MVEYSENNILDLRLQFPFNCVIDRWLQFLNIIFLNNIILEPVSYDWSRLLLKNSCIWSSVPETIFSLIQGNNMFIVYPQKGNIGLSLIQGYKYCTLSEGTLSVP